MTSRSTRLVREIPIGPLHHRRPHRRRRRRRHHGRVRVRRGRRAGHPGDQGPRHERHDHRRARRLRRGDGEGRQPRAPSSGHPEVRRRTGRSGPGAGSGSTTSSTWSAISSRGAPSSSATPSGALDLKMFPSHSRPRAVHHYDTTGNMMTKVLSKKLRADARIDKHSITADCRSRSARWPRRRRLGRRLREGRARHLQRAPDDPVHRRRQRAVLCQ